MSNRGRERQFAAPVALHPSNTPSQLPMGVIHRPIGALHRPLGLWEIGVSLGYIGLWGACYLAFMNAFPRARVTLMTSPFRDEVQVPVDPETMEPLPAHE